MLCVSISQTKKRSSSIMLEENTDVVCNTVTFLPRLHQLSPLARQPRFSSVQTLTSSLSWSVTLADDFDDDFNQSTRGKCCISFLFSRVHIHIHTLCCRSTFRKGGKRHLMKKSLIKSFKVDGQPLYEIQFHYGLRIQFLEKCCLIGIVRQRREIRLKKNSNK